MYAIVCYDRPDSAALRDEHRAAHQNFLKRNEKKIVFGGPLSFINELKNFKAKFPKSPMIAQVDMILPQLERRLAAGRTQ